MSNFETGVFKQYRFTSKVHLGAVQQDVPEGTIVEYDGSVMKWGGQTYTIPQLQAGIRAGWLVPAEDQTSTYHPQPAGVRVRPAQSAGSERGEPMQMEEASEEEQIVGSVEGFKDHQNQAREAAAITPPRPKPKPQAPAPEPEDAPEDAPYGPGEEPTSTPVPDKATVTMSEEVPTEVEYVTPAPPPAPTPEPETPKTGRKMEVISDTAENEGAEAVANIRTPAKQKTLITDSSAAAQAVSQLDNKPPPKAEKIAKPQSQDIRATGPDGATGDVSVAKAGDDLTDLLPDAATSPTPPATPNINWDTKAHWRSRVQSAVNDYGDNPAALRQILAQETPNVAKHIRSMLAREGKSIE